MLYFTSSQHFDVTVICSTCRKSYLVTTTLFLLWLTTDSAVGRFYHVTPTFSVSDCYLLNMKKIWLHHNNILLWISFAQQVEVKSKVTNVLKPSKKKKENLWRVGRKGQNARHINHKCFYQTKWKLYDDTDRRKDGMAVPRAIHHIPRAIHHTMSCILH